MVLALFVAATAIALSQLHTAPTTSAATPSSTGTSTTSPAHPATTTTTHPPSTVPVLVANATGAAGAAAAVTNQLQVGGWNMQPPVNASARVPTSHVYYLAGQEQAARSIASALHLPSSAVVPYTTAAPVSSIGTAEVVVVVGSDLTSASSSTTSTTAPSSHSSTAN